MSLALFSQTVLRAYPAKSCLKQFFEQTPTGLNFLKVQARFAYLTANISLGKVAAFFTGRTGWYCCTLSSLLYSR
jgi:hypothetical protein